MNQLALPALDGRRPLGFLAAVGALRVLTEDAGLPHTGLSWDSASMTARLHLPDGVGIDDVVSALEEVVATLGQDRWLPGVQTPLPRQVPNTDGMRMTPPLFADHYRQWRAGEPDSRRLDAWLAGLITDQVLEREGPAHQLRVIRTPMVAPFARQTLRTMFEKATEHCRPPSPRIRQALLRWERVAGYTGEYFDDHALVDSADSPEGDGDERAVPGATWLALMALPVFPVFGSTDIRVAAIGWQRLRRRAAVMRWPLWEPGLDLDAVRALLAHPALRLAGGEDGSPLRPADPHQLQVLGVLTVCAADRLVIRLGTQSKRVLKAVPVITGGPGQAPDMVQPTPIPTR